MVGKVISDKALHELHILVAQLRKKYAHQIIAKRKLKDQQHIS